MVHLRNAHTLLLCPNTVLFMHGLLMHTGGHNQGMEDDSLWVFARVQVGAHKEFQPQCASPTPGIFYTNELEMCNWHLCPNCQGDRGINMDTQGLLDLDEHAIGNFQVHGWVILKVPGLAKKAEGSFTAQSIYITHLW